MAPTSKMETKPLSLWFVECRLEAMLAQPGALWGSIDAFEMQVLTLLEVLQVMQGQTLNADKPSTLIADYIKFKGAKLEREPKVEWGLSYTSFRTGPTHQELADLLSKFRATLKNS